MLCEKRMKFASMCLVEHAIDQPVLLEFLLARGADPNCRSRGLDQYNHRSTGPPPLHDARFKDAPSWRNRIQS